MPQRVSTHLCRKISTMHISTVGQFSYLKESAPLSIVAEVGEHIHQYLSYLPGLTDLIGRTGLYVPSWVRQFYASLWIDP